MWFWSGAPDQDETRLVERLRRVTKYLQSKFAMR
jgi:hypothetical protein